eukprot:2579654-Pleurochrysis_carterae.AAC.1
MPSTSTTSVPPAPEAPQQPPTPPHFQRTLGTYPLRSRQPSALLLTRARADKPVWGRGTGCAFAVNNVSTDPRTRKQAMAEDRIGWGGAERSEIDNHAKN